MNDQVVKEAVDAILKAVETNMTNLEPEEEAKILEIVIGDLGYKLEQANEAIEEAANDAYNAEKGGEDE